MKNKNFKGKIGMLIVFLIVVASLFSVFNYSKANEEISIGLCNSENETQCIESPSVIFYEGGSFFTQYELDEETLEYERINSTYYEAVEDFNVNIDYEISYIQDNSEIDRIAYLCEGDKFRVQLNNFGEWHAVGGNTDTPPVYWIDGAENPGIDTSEGSQDLIYEQIRENTFYGSGNWRKFATFSFEPPNVRVSIDGNQCLRVGDNIFECTTPEGQDSMFDNYFDVDVEIDNTFGRAFYYTESQINIDPEKEPYPGDTFMATEGEMFSEWRTPGEFHDECTNQHSNSPFMDYVEGDNKEKCDAVRFEVPSVATKYTLRGKECIEPVETGCNEQKIGKFYVNETELAGGDFDSLCNEVSQFATIEASNTGWTWTCEDPNISSNFTECSARKIPEIDLGCDESEGEGPVAVNICGILEGNDTSGYAVCRGDWEVDPINWTSNCSTSWEYAESETLSSGACGCEIPEEPAQCPSAFDSQNNEGEYFKYSNEEFESTLESSGYCASGSAFNEDRNNQGELITWTCSNVMFPDQEITCGARVEDEIVPPSCNQSLLDDSPYPDFYYAEDRILTIGTCKDGEEQGLDYDQAAKTARWNCAVPGTESVRCEISWEEASCGDGNCDPGIGENTETCPLDCQEQPTCNDTCESLNSCSPNEIVCGAPTDCSQREACQVPPTCNDTCESLNLCGTNEIICGEPRDCSGREACQEPPACEDSCGDSCEILDICGEMVDCSINNPSCEPTQAPACAPGFEFEVGENEVNTFVPNFLIGNEHETLCSNGQIYNFNTIENGWVWDCR